MSLPSRCLSAARVANYSIWTRFEVGRQVPHEVSQRRWSCFLGCLLPLIGVGRHVSLGIGRSPMRSNAPQQILHGWRKQKHGFNSLPRIAWPPDRVETTSLRSYAGRHAGEYVLCGHRDPVCPSLPYGEVLSGRTGTSTSRVSAVPKQVVLDGGGAGGRDNGRRQGILDG